MGNSRHRHSVRLRQESSRRMQMLDARRDSSTPVGQTSQHQSRVRDLKEKSTPERS